jgi:hypothetical protein
MNEFPPDVAPHEVVPETPPFIEWPAIIIGCAVGCAMYWLQWVVFGVFMMLSDAPGPISFPIPDQNRRLTIAAILHICFILSTGVAIGVISASRARFNKYRNAFVSSVGMALLYIVWQCSSGHSNLQHLFSGWPLSWQIVVFSRIIGLLLILAALYGAYMAQSFKRNRGVKIE